MLLAEPLTINHVHLRNRIVMPPMATGGSADGAPTEELIAHYADRAIATGLIIVEHEYVSSEGMANKGQLSMESDEVVPAYRALTERVHRQGAAIVAQISHAGSSAGDTSEPLLAPSSVPTRRDGVVPREMTPTDINRVRSCFAEAAIRAKRAGFDGVEVHAAHGYLLNQFYSPLTNKRTDRYTGSTLEGRLRLLCEVLEAVRHAVGDDYLVAIRFGACDYREGGSMADEVPQAVAAFECAGADLVDISGGLSGFVVPSNRQPGWFSDLGSLAKGAVDVPVLVTGGVKTADDAERLLAEGACDLVGVGRAMMRDAAWAQKALA